MLLLRTLIAVALCFVFSSNASGRPTKGSPALVTGKIIGCDSKQPGHCRVRLGGNAVATLPEGPLPGPLDFYYQDLLVYRAKSAEVSIHETPDGRVVSELTTEGHWNLTAKARQNYLKSPRMLTALLQSRDNVEGRVVAFSNDGQEASDEALPQQLEIASRESPRQSRAEVGLMLRAGTPSSPTALSGLELEFYPSRVLLFGIGYGVYDSHRFMPIELGRIRYQTTSATAALVVGKLGGHINLGVTGQRIHASYAAGDDASATTATDRVVTEQREDDYWMVSPRLGLRFETASQWMLGVDLGAFASAPGAYSASAGAPVNYKTKLQTQQRPLMHWVSAGIGWGF